MSDDGVYFEDDEISTKTDVIIFATGYETKIPFLDDKYYKANNGCINLYKHIYPLGLKHPTLAVIGFLQSNGPIAPISELQCRWAANIFNRKQKLPEKQLMESYMQKKLDSNKDLSSKLEEDFITYMDDLANECGAKPSLSTFLFKDPSLFWLCMTGPFLPYQYRLTGLHSWNGARQAIFQCPQRISTPLDTRIQEKNNPMKNFQDYKTLTET
ncbi:dimethylaniline monooxygenase [N-oxide-forming] 2-like [Uloborus diversus]|uniref:dimethylaniline monooxygenase [N-oxide-forming] 2-like n=1 Tax=Uloborus diversus TaxID=327109 RepID=UPI00240A78DA|nr:dimethylaniline monooxygenase [N-oxide-forming] 2-like [Uloborus diversus]